MARASQSWKVDVGYGFGYLGIALVTQVVVTWALYFYAPPSGTGLPALAPAFAVGIAMAIGRIVDAVADPLVAVWSDNLRSPKGRRVPFLLAGGLPLSLVFAMLWRPPVLQVSWLNTLYLGAMLSLFFFLFTVYVAPYLAILPEIAASQNHRLRLVGFQGLFNVIGVVAGSVVSGVLIARWGYAAMGWMLGLVALLGFYIPVWALKGTKWPLPGERIPLLRSLKAAWSTPGFRVYLASQVLFWFGFNMVMMVVPYVATVLMRGRESDVALLMGVSLGTSLLTLGPITKAAAHYGMRRVFLVTMGVLAIDLSLLGLIGMGPISPWALAVTIMFIAGFPLAGLFTLPNALLSEIVEKSARQKGVRQEAMFFGIQGLINKAALALSSAIGSGVLSWFGYSLTKDLGVRLIGPIAAISVAAGFFVFLRFPYGRTEADPDREEGDML